MLGTNFNFDVYSFEDETMSTRVKEALDSIWVIERTVEHHESAARRNTQKEADNKKDKSEIDSNEKKEVKDNKKQGGKSKEKVK